MRSSMRSMRSMRSSMRSRLVCDIHFSGLALPKSIRLDFSDSDAHTCHDKSFVIPTGLYFKEVIDYLVNVVLFHYYNFMDNPILMWFFYY